MGGGTLDPECMAEAGVHFSQSARRTRGRARPLETGAQMKLAAFGQQPVVRATSTGARALLPAWNRHHTWHLHQEIPARPPSSAPCTRSRSSAPWGRPHARARVRAPATVDWYSFTVAATVRRPALCVGGLSPFDLPSLIVATCCWHSAIVAGIVLRAAVAVAPRLSLATAGGGGRLLVVGTLPRWPFTAVTEPRPPRPLAPPATLRWPLPAAQQLPLSATAARKSLLAADASPGPLLAAAATRRLRLAVAATRLLQLAAVAAPRSLLAAAAAPRSLLASAAVHE